MRLELSQNQLRIQAEHILSLCSTCAHQKDSEGEHGFQAWLYSTPNRHFTIVSDLVFHVYLAKDPGRKKVHPFGSLIIMVYLPCSRNSMYLKSLINTLIKMNSFS